MKGLIFGATGMVGSGLVNAWKDEHTLVTPTRQEADLMDCEDFRRWCKANGSLIDTCDVVIYAAGDVGGIGSQNNYHKQLTNTTMYLNFMECLKYIRQTARVINLSSSCMYPVQYKFAIEDDLFRGNIEETNFGYGMAKLFGTTLLQTWNEEHPSYAKAVTFVLPNLYSSISDNNFNLKNSHVAQALVTKFKYAVDRNHPKVKVWGSGNAVREYMDVAELPNIIEAYLSEENPEYDIYNVGSKGAIQIKDYAYNIAKILDYTGNIVFDITMPEGALYKVMDNTRFVHEFDYRPRFNEFDMISQLLENIS